MSTLDRLPGVDSRCRYKTADGRRCTMLKMDDHPSLCYTHWRQQLVQTESYDHEGAAAELLGSIEDFNTATAVNQALGRLFALLARNRIPPRNAAILAYIGQLLLNSLPAVDRETMRAEGLPGWEQTLTRAMQIQRRSSAASEQEKAGPADRSPCRTSIACQALLDGADGEPGDKAVEEHIVQQGDGQAGDQAGSHQRAPVIHVAAHQKSGHANADHLVGLRRDERQRVHKFLGHQGERENHHCEDTRG